MKADQRSHGLWQASAPPAPVCERLQGPVQADVAVIGAGFTGLSAALHLAQAGVRVVVLEGAQIGFGGSGRNVGLVNAGLWLEPEALLKTLGAHYGGRLLHLLSGAPAAVYELVAQHRMDCQAVQTGTLHCAVGAGGLRNIRKRWRQWQDLGAPVELLNQTQVAAATGTTAYAGALLDRRAGTLQPLAYVRGLARAAITAGARIYEQSAVRRVEDGRTHWVLQTQDGEVLAPWVIVATNAYTSEVWPDLPAELVRLPYFNVATQPLDAALRAQILPGGQGAWDTRSVLSSYRFDQAGRLVFGSVGALRERGRAIHTAWAQRALQHLFPALRHVQFDYEWYGWIGMTSDAVPRLHQLGRQVLSFSGYNGRGIAP
ncbi:MAG: NAD(P)/FAD-dependent oxidoreductase, partial [Alcaligenes aquatilis]